MIIYHGSKQIIEKPILKGSNASNDYGPAFYMSLDLDAAKSWACRNNSIGIVNKYSISEFKFKNFKILDLRDKERYSVLNWIAILMHFRSLDDSFIKKNKLVLEWLNKFYIDVDQYDVVIGYRADDAYFRFPAKFISNDLSLEDLENTFKLGNLGVQYAFISKRAIDSLKFITSIECDEQYLGHYFKTVNEATFKFDELLQVERDPRKTYVLDLMRKDYE